MTDRRRLTGPQTFVRRVIKLVYGPLVPLAPEWTVVKRAPCRWCSHRTQRSYWFSQPVRGSYSARDFLQWEFCGLQLSNHQNFHSGHDCTNTSFARSPRCFYLQASKAIWVLRKVRVDTMFARTGSTFVRDSTGNSWKYLELSWSSNAGLLVCLLVSNAGSCDEDDDEVSVGVLEELVDEPGTTNGNLTHCNQFSCPFLVRCGFWPLVQRYTHDPRRASREKELREFLQEA